MFTIIWIAIFAIGLVVELFALFNKRKGDTLSEQIWKLRLVYVARIILIPLWAWLTWHFFMEPNHWSARAGVWLDDLIIIVVFILVALFASYHQDKTVIEKASHQWPEDA